MCCRHSFLPSVSIPYVHPSVVPPVLPCSCRSFLPSFLPSVLVFFLPSVLVSFNSLFRSVFARGGVNRRGCRWLLELALGLVAQQGRLSLHCAPQMPCPPWLSCPRSPHVGGRQWLCMATCVSHSFGHMQFEAASAGPSPCGISIHGNLDSGSA